ncbi:NUDIX domain-containing protein [Olivibacter sp. SDN3]|uniref:NUDIX domain-containing protein n=1 Tax=Olivibacter sp. SDN3 TaxID=2764720 RepID=UPI001650FE52|nr:NUDIX domain-containing protein [Olivibacter sp. SDN3]QNL47972.1 NUDIX domain-containing protein [Olivibacter sp. SDN3]
MAKQSAGLLVFRRKPALQVFLVHPGGPYFAKKDLSSWTIPKGEYPSHEQPLEAAKREFHEETGTFIDGVFIPLPTVKQKGGKIILAWAVEADLDEATIHSNTFAIEWPPRSGKAQRFPEIDKAAWFTITEDKLKINPAQIPWLEELEASYS